MTPNRTVCFIEHDRGKVMSLQLSHMKMTLSFYVLVLEVLLLVGGVEPNPGPLDQGNCELCGAVIDVITQDIIKREEKVSGREKSLRESEEHLQHNFEGLLVKEKLIQRKLQMLKDREEILAAKEKLLADQEKLKSEMEIAFLKSCVSMDVKEKSSSGQAPPATPDALTKAITESKTWDVRCILQTLSVEHRFKNRMTPLLLACEEGQLSVVKYLIEEAGACVSAADSSGKTALHWAACNGHCDIVQYLVQEAKMSPSVKTAQLETPLYCASQFAHLNIVRFLVEEANVDLYDRQWESMTAMHIAAQQGHMHIVTYLGVKSNQTSFGTAKDGMTALHLASQSRHVDVVMYLVNSGAESKEVKNSKGYTAAGLTGNYLIRQFLS